MSETWKYAPGPFHIGMVADGNGLQSCNEAFVTVGSPEGQDEDDCEIIIKGAHVHEVARLVAAAPAMCEYIASAASAGCATAKKILEDIHANS